METTTKQGLEQDTKKFKNTKNMDQEQEEKTTTQKHKTQQEIHGDKKEQATKRQIKRNKEEHTEDGKCCRMNYEKSTIWKQQSTTTTARENTCNVDRNDSAYSDS